MNEIYGNVTQKKNSMQIKHFAFKHNNDSKPFTYYFVEISFHASKSFSTLVIQENICKKTGIFQEFRKETMLILVKSVDYGVKRKERMT
jgi:hypothetical protein